MDSINCAINHSLFILQQVAAAEEMLPLHFFAVCFM